MFWKYNIWGFVCILFILIASAAPGDKIPSDPFFDFDKVVHMAIYAVLMASWCRGLLLQSAIPVLRKHNILFAFVISEGYGLLMEVLQGLFFYHRTFDWEDVLANTIGVILAFAVWGLFFQKKIRQKV